MNIQDLYTFTFISNIFSNITGNKFYDTIIIGIITFYFLLSDNRKFKSLIKRVNEKIFDSNYNKIKIMASKKKQPLNFKSILWFISNNKNNSIKYIEQFSNFQWDRNDNRVEKEQIYVINQDYKFKITDEIYGKMNKESIEDSRNAHGVHYEDFYYLTLYSKTKRLDEIIEWSDNIVKEYKKHMKLKSIQSQLLLSVSYQKELVVESSEFDSTVTFQNSYLPNYNEIMGKIDFFLNNKEWYTRKGIPYNLGIMLYGEPGCGKTRFIKQLMNYTVRHGIDIKLNDDFDFNTLRNIIHNENITDEFIIPQEKRIIIFEDIDAMCEILKDRKSKENETQEKENNNNSNKNSNNNSNNNLNKKNTILELKDDKLNNNNLSFFLNIIDGLNECSGRIIIMTTNRIDYLDKAIIRPGRIDIKINFTKYSSSDVCGIINKFWGKNFQVSDIKSDVDYKYTSAEIVNIFRKSNCFNDIKDSFIK